MKASKDDDHSEEVLDENRRYHLTSTFRSGADQIDGFDEVWDEDAHKTELEWDGNEGADGFDGNDNLIDDNCGELYE